MSHTIWIERVPNQDILVFRSHQPLFQSLRTTLKNLENPLNNSIEGLFGDEDEWEKTKLLFSLPGVISAFLETAELTLKKAPLFDWDVLAPLVISVLEGKKDVVIPSIPNQAAYRRVPEPKYVEFHTSFLVSQYSIESVYPLHGHLRRQDKEERIGKLGMDILKAITEFVGVSRINHFYIHPYEVGVVMVNEVLLDFGCEEICSIIAKTAEIENCKFNMLPRDKVNAGYVDDLWSLDDVFDW